MYLSAEGYYCDMLHPQVVDRQEGIWSWRIIENKLNKRSTSPPPQLGDWIQG
jgi:hypothetical protein